jgi:microcystin-dependent protein
MGSPYIAEIKICAFNFAPKGWALCNGATLPINQNQALFSLLGTTFGGNGQTTFNLPNLQGRIAMHFGNGYTMGQAAGEANHTLILTELPTHSHGLVSSTAKGTLTSPVGSYPAACTANPYSNASPNTVTAAVSNNTGGSQPHSNMAPYLALSFCIALVGIFPSRN